MQSLELLTLVRVVADYQATIQGLKARVRELEDAEKSRQVEGSNSRPKQAFEALRAAHDRGIQ